MNIFSEYKGLRREMYILCIGRIMTSMGAMIFPMLTLILNKKLGMSAGLIALYMTVFSIVSMPISLIGGKMADHINKKNIILVCDLISIATFFYCSTVEISFKSILIFAAGALFQSIEGPAYEALVADLTSSKDRERAYSLTYLGGNLGLVLSPTIGGILFENHLNLAFFINGAAIASSTILIFFFLKDIERVHAVEEKNDYEAELDDDISALSYLLKNRVILLYALLGMLSYGIYSMFNYLMPLTLGAIHGEKGSFFFGTMTSVNCAIVVIFTALITRWFRRVLDIDKIFIGQALINSGFFIFLIGVSHPVICYISMVIFTFGEIFNTLSASPFLTRRIPASHRGRIMSITNVSGFLGCSAFQLMVGFICDKKGYTSAWTAVITAGILLLLLIRLLRRIDYIDYHSLYQQVD